MFSITARLAATGEKIEVECGAFGSTTIREVKQVLERDAKIDVADAILVSNTGKVLEGHLPLHDYGIQRGDQVHVVPQKNVLQRYSEDDAASAAAVDAPV